MSGVRRVVVGSRESRLAVAQAMVVIDALRAACPGVEVGLATMKTTGDRILDRTLDKVGGKGLFVRELDQALRDGRIDLAVHSLKDMPMETPEDLPVLCCTRREDPRDALVLPRGAAALRPGGVIGTSSLRRAIQLRRLYPECEIRPVRGNLLTRLQKLDGGQFDALALAAAGLKRLGLEDRISRVFAPDEVIPAAGQGILAVQGRRDAAFDGLSACADGDAALCAACERAFVRALDGGCSSPVCAHATVADGGIFVRGLYWDEENGARVGTAEGDARDAAAIGAALARRLREASGREAR